MKTCLIILDGWGFNKNKRNYDAINNSICNNMRQLSKLYPSFLLHASGKYVGLPTNKMGNSEVGHLTIGSGRIVKQLSTIIDDSISDGTICDIFKPVTDLQIKVIHLVIMISDGGIHSHINHLFGVIEILKTKFETIYINCITDGRDTAPYVAMSYINEVLDYCEINSNCKISTIGGRFYGMDRDKNINRIEEYFDVLTKDIRIVNDIQKEIEAMYNKDMNDETLIPFRTTTEGVIGKNDTIVFLNFRSDRMRQIVERFISNGNRIFTMVEYKKDLPVEILYNKSPAQNTLSEVLSSNNIAHSHIAESEKYAHVTYFFNGGCERQFEHERRFIINSPKVKSFDDQPEMSSEKVTEKIIHEINFDTLFIIANFASPDMVGHTGNYDATLKAIAKVDECIGKIYSECHKKMYVLFITADHGNAEVMFDEKNNIISKKHTSNKVPFIICNEKVTEKKGEWGYIDSEFTLCDIAPTILSSYGISKLSLYGISKPTEMTGRSVL